MSRTRVVRVKPAKLRAKKKSTQVSEHIVTKSIRIVGGEGDPSDVVIDLCTDGSDTGGMWISQSGNPNRGASVYFTRAEGPVIGIRDEGTGLAAALHIGEGRQGCIQLRKSDGKMIHITADELASLLGK